MAATARQNKMYRFHKDACVRLGIGQSTFQHMGLKGTVTAPNSAGTSEYINPGPVADYSEAVEGTTMVWLVFQPFIRGEERGDAIVPGIIETSLQQGQMPAIDDKGNVIEVSEDDLITTIDGRIYDVMNPVISPDMAWWTFLLEQKR